jgi:hypothetical protein
MKPTTINRKTCNLLQFATLMLLGYWLAGCAVTDSPPPESSAPSNAQRTINQTVHVIIYFQKPTTDNQPLSAAISDACHCMPAFFRAFGNDGLIYSISLPEGQDYSAFENELMLHAPQLGITTMEQDGLMQAD